MSDRDRTNPELIEKISVLKQKIQKLEQSESERKKEEALRESEAKYQAAFELCTDAIFWADVHTEIIINCNRAAENMIGVPRDKLIGQHRAMIHPPELKEFYAGHFRRHAERGSTEESEAEVISTSGQRIPVLISATRLKLGNREVLQGIFRDITDLRRAEEALQESEQRLLSIIQGSPIPTFVIGKDHRIIYWNRALEKLSRIPAGTIIGTNQHWRAFYVQERPCMADLLVDEVVDKIPQWYEGKYIKSSLIDGAYEATDFFPALGKKGDWLRFTAAAVRDSHGNLVGAVETLEDVTERKRVEEALRESEERFRKLADSTWEGIIIHRGGIILDVNESILKMFGWHAEEVIGKSALEFLAPESIEPALQKLRESIDAPQIYLEAMGLKKDKTAFPIEVLGRPIRYKNFDARVIAIRDITDRKRAEEALMAGEERYRTIIENIEDGYHEVDLEGNFTFFNESFRKIMGYGADELLGMNNRQYADSENALKVYQTYNQLYRTGIPIDSFEWNIIRKDGNPRTVEVSASLIRDAQGKPTGFRGIVRDITARKRAEEALQESELKYRTLVELTHDFVFMVDRKGLFTYVNPNFEKTTGYSFSDLKGHPFTIVIAPDERETIIDRFKKGVRGAPSLPYETELSDKEGKRVAVEFLTSNLCDIRGNVTGRFGVGRDITKRKEVEALLRDSEKRYRDLSIIDDLTQLYNSRYFYHQLKLETDRVNRYKEQPMTLLLLDLDDFKAFNDAYGHVGGDQVLSRLGQVVKRCLRQTDSAYRYGGEEFTILLPMTTSTDGAVTAERNRTE
ncbi:MAG TPA: PAS domain S-box protein, partial [Syntrophales bacterium]